MMNALGETKQGDNKECLGNVQNRVALDSVWGMAKVIENDLYKLRSRNREGARPVQSWGRHHCPGRGNDRQKPGSGKASHGHFLQFPTFSCISLSGHTYHSG